MNRPTAGRVALIVLDGVGIGAAPDQAEYGDRGSNTLGNLARAVGGLHLPHLESLGLDCCRPPSGLRCAGPSAAHGVALPRSPGKDSTTGHWEICQLLLERPFPTYPRGFPPHLIERFARLTGRPVFGNSAGSGVAAIDELGAKHIDTGAWIVYTSVDSVFQVAAHEDHISLDELYEACRVAREEVLVKERAVARVIARPFTGEEGAFERTPHRRDFSLAPPGPTLLDTLAAAGVERTGIGKVDDLFAGRHITSTHPANNAEAYELISETLEIMRSGLLFANVVDFDQAWGHRNDVEGFYRGLRELDEAVPQLTSRLLDWDLMIITADHGNDPTTPSTDHSREAVPVLVVGKQVVSADLGTRRTMADLGATVAEYFQTETSVGTSFLREVAPWMTV